MKKTALACVTTLLILGVSTAFNAQKRSLQLEEVTQQIERVIQEKMPGWRRRPITPMPAGGVINEQVAIDHWINEDHVVKISIVTYESDDRADNVLKRHANEKNKKPVANLGDEAFMLNGSEVIAFRKHNLIISVAELGRDLPKKDSALAKKFARCIADALDEPKK